VAQTTTLGSFLDDEPFACSRDWDGFLATMRAAADRGGRYAAIELTSEALARGFARVWPCRVGVFTNLSHCRVGVFTNLSHDHLDAHGSPEHYLASKAQLFLLLPQGGAAVLNACDAAAALVGEVVPGGVRIVRYAVPSRGEQHADPEILATSVEPSWSGTRVAVRVRGFGPETVTELRIRAIGDVYAENALAALGAALVSGVPLSDATAALAEAPVPRGRFEPVTHEANGPHVVVDYAHTPDALARTIATARALCRGNLVVVFGAGGDRDVAKRAPMGAASSRADRVVLTSDNPRGEDPARIADAIRAGIAPGTDVRVVLDRREAIRSVVLDAGEDDVILVAGKGHETDQTAGGVTRPFDDAAEARNALSLRGRSGASSPSSST
jgi:UDP-N-acetylmuramoyl-L-alanyl-D-glutamate--2,6-diaminopimelate ligase